MQEETVKLELEVSNITGDQIDELVKAGVEKTASAVASFLLARGFSNLEPFCAGGFSNL